MAKTRPPYKPEFRPLSSVTAAARPACAPRWARLATPTTMRCARASSPRWNASFSTGLGSRRRPRRGSVFEFVEALDHNRRRRHSSIGYLSPIDYKLRHAANPDAHQPATVLASVKDKPFGQKFVEGFGRRPRRGGAARRRGRGPKAFRERTRGKWVSALPRVLWGFRRDVGARGRC
jgi:hypothetical protein